MEMKLSGKKISIISDRGCLEFAPAVSPLTGWRLSFLDCSFESLHGLYVFYYQ